MIVTVVPLLTIWPAAGLWLSTMPPWLLVVTSWRWTLAGNPDAPSVASADPRRAPTTSGTAIVGGALATTSVIVEPGLTEVPPTGALADHRPGRHRGRDLRRLADRELPGRTLQLRLRLSEALAGHVRHLHRRRAGRDDDRHRSVHRGVRARRRTGADHLAGGDRGARLTLDPPNLQVRDLDRRLSLGQRLADHRRDGGVARSRGHRQRDRRVLLDLGPRQGILGDHDPRGFWLVTVNWLTLRFCVLKPARARC